MFEPGATERAHDAGSHGLAQPEGIADGQHEIAHPQSIGVAERQRLEIVGLYLEHRDIGARIAADQLGLQPPPILERHHDLLGFLHHVVVAEHIAVPGIEDDARACRDLRAGLLGQPEEAAEERVLHHRVVLLRRAGQHRDVHHCRRDLLQQRGQRGDFAVQAYRRDASG